MKLRITNTPRVSEVLTVHLQGAQTVVYQISLFKVATQLVLVALTLFRRIRIIAKRDY
jgi:hypothetical protein